MGEHGVGEAFEQGGVVVFAELFGHGVLDFVTGDRGVSFRQPVRNHRGELLDRNLFDPITRTPAGGRADRDRAVRSQHCRGGYRSCVGEELVDVVAAVVDGCAVVAPGLIEGVLVDVELDGAGGEGRVGGCGGTGTSRAFEFGLDLVAAFREVLQHPARDPGDVCDTAA